MDIKKKNRKICRGTMGNGNGFIKVAETLCGIGKIPGN